MIYLSAADIFKINFFEKLFQQHYQKECQTGWIQIKPDIL